MMRTGPHLGGGPGVKTGPDPAGRPPWVRFRPPTAPTGVLIVLQWWPDGTRTLRYAGRAFCRASGVAASVAFSPGLGHFSGGRMANVGVACTSYLRGGAWLRLR